MCKTITLENSYIDISREHVKLKKLKSQPILQKLIVRIFKLSLAKNFAIKIINLVIFYSFFNLCNIISVNFNRSGQ